MTQPAIVLRASTGELDAPASVATVPERVADGTSGRVVRGTFRTVAGERAWRLYLPDGGVPDGGRALVVMLHGCTQDAEDVARGTRLHEIAGARGWMVLYPEQSATAHAQRCWHWYDPAHQQRDAGEPAILAGMTAQVVVDYGGDATRVFLAGVSAGAAMASLVVAAYPEQYAALALHSGLVHGAAATVAQALDVMRRGVPSPEPYATSALEAMGRWRRVIPTLAIHGEADEVVAPINGSQAAQQWFLTNALIMGQPLDTTSGATDRSEREEQGYLVRRSTYRAKDGTPLSRLVMIRELGHAWSGGAAEGAFTDMRGPNASTMVVEFFAGIERR